MNSGLSGRQKRLIPASSVIVSEEEAVTTAGRLPFKEKDEIAGVALVKNILAPEIFTIDQPGNSRHQARWCLVYIK